MFPRYQPTTFRSAEGLNGNATSWVVWIQWTRRIGRGVRDMYDLDDGVLRTGEAESGEERGRFSSHLWLERELP